VRYDLVVMGGGPAGSAAATTAARLGARVLLLERGRFPRQKVCGEFVSAESLSLLSALLGDTRRDLLDPAMKISAARLFIGRRTVQVDVVPGAASITRFELDAALWAAAQGAGVEARSQTTVQSIRGAGPFGVITREGEFEGSAVIDASGRWSNLRTHHPDQGPSAKWIGLKAHFFEAAPSGTVDLYFFEGGYCGVQPIRASRPAVNACAMVRADVATTLQEVFGQHPALRERSAAWEQIGDAVSTSPLMFSQPQPIRNGIACAGDAAGFVDPFIGDGISLALHSGVLAGQWMARGDFSSALGQYADEYSRRLLPVFRRSARLRRMLSLPHVVLGSILPLMKVGWVGRSVVSATRVGAA